MCERCDDMGEVGILSASNVLFSSIGLRANVPMSVSPRRARVLIEGFDDGTGVGVFVRQLASNVASTPCPNCANAKLTVEPVEVRPDGTAVGR